MTQSSASTTPPRIRALLIINPKSRQGAEAGLEDGLRRLQQAGMDVETRVSHSADESCEAVLKRRAELDLVIVGGGDGTLSSMIKTLLTCDLPLAILPLGTANDLARSLDIPEALELAFEIIAINHRIRIDLGEVNGHYYFNAANMGLGVHVTEELTREVKKHWGVFSYLRALVAAVMRHDQFHVRMTLDGKHYRHHSMHLAVGNGRFYGGGNVINEKTRIDDGKLSLFSMRPLRAWELLTLAPLLRNGQQNRDRRMFCAQATEIDISAGRRRLDIHADGEPVTRTPAKFRVLPKAMTVVAPAMDAHNHIQENITRASLNAAPAHTDQGVITKMGILRSEQQVALQQLYRLVQESIDHYQDSAEFVEDSNAAQLFTRIASEREPLAEQLAQAIRDTGDLPAAPDADKETGEQLLHRLRAWFTADQTRDVVEQRLQAEAELARVLADTKNQSSDPIYQDLHQRFVTQVENAGRTLKQAHPA